MAFLLDRSGSMATVQVETIGGFNGYIDELLKKDDGTMRFTLTQFDAVGVDVLHDQVELSEVKKLDETTYKPRGGTPLYDAMGKTINSIEAKKGSKVLFVTLTDGHENASSEWSESTVRKLIKEKEAAGWTFAYIGVGLEGFDAVHQLSKGTVSAANVLRSRPEDTAKTYRQMGGMTCSYSASAIGGQSVAGVWEKDEDKA